MICPTLPISSRNFLVTLICDNYNRLIFTPDVIIKLFYHMFISDTEKAKNSDLFHYNSS